MLGFINKGIAKVFGTKSDRDIKELTPYVNLINEEFQQLVAISDDDLRNKISNNGYETVKKNFSLENYKSKYLNIIENAG